MFSIGETRPNCHANEPQEHAQGTRHIRRGRLNNETPEQRERRLQIQREQRRRRRHQETTEQRQHRLAQQRQRRQEETEEQRNRRLEYHRQYNQGRRALETLEDRQFRLDLTRARFDNETPFQRELRLHRIRRKQTQRLINETEQERNLRFQTLRTNQTQRLINETEQERDLRLQTLRTNQAQRLINETEQQRDLRLQTLRTNQEQRLINETEQERDLRLQTLRTNQAQRLINETEQERDLRLQTLRTNQSIRIQAGTNPQAEVFRELLMRMRNGQSTQCDWQKLCERTPQHINMDNFKDAPRLFFDKASVAKYNYEKLSNLATPIARISAVHSGRNAKAATSDDAGGLEAVIFLARGAAVMLTCNLWQEVGLCNGASGVVHDLIFHPERPPPCLPIAALVDFPHYTGPPFLHTHPQIVPIPPHLFEWETEGQRLSRQQLPLRLSYAMTIHKSQGQTLSIVVIDLGKAERAAGCSFVALSRVRSLDNVVLQPLSFQRLQVIGKSKQLQQRLREEERLQQLAEITARQYQHRH